MAMSEMVTADKFVVHMPYGLHAKYVKKAEENNRSMNSEIVLQLEKGLLEPEETQPAGWTPQIGMLVVYKHDDMQTQPMEILSFGYDRYDDRSEVKLWFKVRMPSGAKNSPVYADMCRPYNIK